MNIAWYFLFYSFVGWCVEVVYHAVKVGKVINRGFLCGPVCPVYGFGMITVFSMTKSVIPSLTGISESDLLDEKNLTGTLIIFLGGMLLATAVELLAGWFLDIAFHARWWDYSNEPFNLHGYICVRFSIIWGCGAVFVVRILQPLMESRDFLTPLVPYIYWLFGVLYAFYAADFVVTVMIVAGLNRQLKELDEMQRSMRVVSDALSEKLGTNTMRTQRNIEETRVQAALAKAELRDGVAQRRKTLAHQTAVKKAAFRWNLMKRADALKTAGNQSAAMMRGSIEEQKSAYARQVKAFLDRLKTRHLFGPARLLKAFPKMTHRDYDELLKKLKEIWDM